MDSDIQLILDNWAKLNPIDRELAKAIGIKPDEISTEKSAENSFIIGDEHGKEQGKFLVE